jgi:Protein of unknown function (DUF742)
MSGPSTGPDGSDGSTEAGADGAQPGRLYLLAKAQSMREGGAEAPLDLITLIVATGQPGPDVLPEHAAILRMCQSPLSVAEISAYLQLPFRVLTVLLAELAATGRVEARAPVPAALLPDISLIEAVMHGLQRL